nr:DUF2384 domain-containing protein [Gammaproteobacteria bacterium]
MQHLTHHERVGMTHALVELLDGWGVGDGDKLKILGLAGTIRSRTFKRYRDGTPFPLDHQVLEHVQHLVGIADALRTTFPRNAGMSAYWMRKPNRHLNHRSPLAVLIQDGLAGLTRVRAHLDCTYAWDLTGSRHTGTHRS